MTTKSRQVLFPNDDNSKWRYFEIVEDFGPSAIYIWPLTQYCTVQRSFTQYCTVQRTFTIISKNSGLWLIVLFRRNSVNRYKFDEGMIK